MAYDFKDNTYSTKPKDDPKDRIEVEIGDSKQPTDFYPQVKIMRWDNEVNLSLRLVSSDQAGQTQEKGEEMSGRRRQRKDMGDVKEIRLCQ